MVKEMSLLFMLTEHVEPSRTEVKACGHEKAKKYYKRGFSQALSVSSFLKTQTQYTCASLLLLNSSSSYVR
jgi:hypothetical protein